MATTKYKEKLFHTISRVAAQVANGENEKAVRTLGFLALRLERVELSAAKGYGLEAYAHQYTPETCPGRPCSSCCDHRGVPPSDAERRYLITERTVKS